VESETFVEAKDPTGKKRGANLVCNQKGVSHVDHDGYRKGEEAKEKGEKRCEKGLKNPFPHLTR